MSAYVSFGNPRMHDKTVSIEYFFANFTASLICCIPIFFFTKSSVFWLPDSMPIKKRVHPASFISETKSSVSVSALTLQAHFMCNPLFIISSQIPTVCFSTMVKVSSTNPNLSILYIFKTSSISSTTFSGDLSLTLCPHMAEHEQNTHW